MSIVVSAGFGIGIAIDPFTVVASKFSQIVIPVGTKAQGIAYESPHDGAGCPVLDDLVRHGILLLQAHELSRITLIPATATERFHQNQALRGKRLQKAA